MGTIARTIPTAFAGLPAPERWPRPRAAPRAHRLAASVESLHGIGPTMARRLGKLGLRTVEDAMDIALLDVLQKVPWRTLGRAVDLACGTGRTGAWLQRNGVEAIDGVDLTP